MSSEGGQVFYGMLIVAAIPSVMFLVLAFFKWIKGGYKEDDYNLRVKMYKENEWKVEKEIKKAIDVLSINGRVAIFENDDNKNPLFVFDNISDYGSDNVLYIIINKELYIANNTVSIGSDELTAIKTIIKYQKRG